LTEKDGENTQLRNRLNLLESNFAKLAMRDLIDAFRSDVIKRFAGPIGAFVPHPPRGDLVLTQKKNFGTLVRTLTDVYKGKPPGSAKITDQMSNLIKSFPNYIAMLEFVSEESRIDSYNSLAHDLKDFIAKDPAARSEMDIDAAKEIVEKLSPTSLPICSGILDFVIDNEIQGGRYSPVASSPTASVVPQNINITPTPRPKKKPRTG
jgi:hypothetical protein